MIPQGLSGARFDTLVWEPLLPLALLAALGAAGLLAAALRARSAPLGAVLRAAALLAFLAFLAGPNLRRAEGERLSDVLLLLVDDSDSMALGGRGALAKAAADALAADAERAGLEVRRRRLGGVAETALGPALTDGLAGVPRARLAGAVLVTDGQLTDVPDPGGLGLSVPLHAVLAGDPDAQRDRRVTLVTEPAYGVVGEAVDLTFRVDDERAGRPIPVTLSVGGEPTLESAVDAGTDVTLRVPLTTPGETILEIAVPPAEGELTLANNRAAIRLRAVRDRLRVLLVSGEPHPGERVWRNILKSDPAVDLVHFTILRPQDKFTFADGDDLNLIAFPHEELFLDRLSEFDVVIFDRYTERGVLQSYEFERVARYVEAGGALLVASGPEFWGRGGLAAQRNLSPVLPALPTGPAVEGAFTPQLTTLGRRHPVTGALDAEGWGRWLRVVPTEVRAGASVLETPDGAPLLVLSRVGEGRVALFNSDHVWLWARGFDGGGPHRELLRRLAHWLMAEPALEEEQLSARVTPAGALLVERRTLEDAPGPVEVEAADGRAARLPLSGAQDGLFTARGEAPDGLLRLRAPTADGRTLYALAARGEARPPERTQVLTTDRVIRPLAEATGGAIVTLAEGAAAPSVRRVAPGRALSGTGWLGLVRRDAELVTAVSAVPLLPRWAWLAGGLGLVLAAWLIEGRRR